MDGDSFVKEKFLESSAASNLAFNEKIKSLKAAGETVFHFGFGQSPFPLPACLVKRLGEEASINDYLTIAGDIKLRKEICSWHAQWEDVDLDPDNLVVAPGSKSLIYLVFAMFSGDILLPAPAWTTYKPQVKLAGQTARVLRQLPGNGWKLTPQDLQEGIEGESGPFLLVLTNPGNPSGSVYSREELIALVQVCRERNILVLSDEIYARLRYEGEHVPISSVYPEGTILTSGFSKCFSAGGWRLGYAHFPTRLQKLREAVISGASHTHSCAPAPVQFAVAAALQNDRQQLVEYILATRKILGAVAEYCHKKLAAVGVQGQAGEAGYYFMPDFASIRNELAARGVHTGQQMCDFFLKEVGVALMPSSAFLLNEKALTVRFCYVTFDGGKCLKQLERLRDSQSIKMEDLKIGETFVSEFCPDIVEGVARLVSLIQSLEYRESS